MAISVMKATVGAASDTDFLRIHVAGRFQKLRAIDFVLQVTAAQILRVRELKFHPIPGRTTRIWRYADVPARHERHHRAVERVLCLACGTAVRKDDRGIRPVALEIEGYPGESADYFAVEGFVVNQYRRRDFRCGEACDCGEAQLARLLRGDVVYPKVSRLGRALVRNHEAGTVWRE